MSPANDAQGPRAGAEPPAEAEPRASTDVLPGPTPRGALRRSLLVWGWGQAATGMRPALLLAPVQAVAIAALILAAITIGTGTGLELVYLGLVGLIVAWGAVALDAYRRAARRRERDGVPGGDGGATELLWLAPILIVASALLWGIGGSGASPSSTTARYVTAWQHDRPAPAAALFVTPPTQAELTEAWERQLTALRAELIRAAATAGPDAGIDPGRPFDSLSFSEDETGRLETAARMRVEIVWWETVHGSFLGLFSTTGRRQVAYEAIGTIELRRLDGPGPLGGTPPGREWRIEQVDLLGSAIPEAP